MAVQATQDAGIVRYRASDGQDVELSPAGVVAYIVSGKAQPDPKDVAAFIAKCQARGLNPLAGDAYMTTYKNNDGTTTSSVIVSKDYFVRTATQQETFDGMRAGVTVLDSAGGMHHREGAMVLPTETLVGGWAEVRDKRWSIPAKAEVALSEYNTGRSLWKSKPGTMIRKVALVQALREAYPNAYGGVYDASEMGEQPEPVAVGATVADVPAVVVEPAQPTPNPDAAWLRAAVQQAASRGYDPAEVEQFLLQFPDRRAAQVALNKMLAGVEPEPPAQPAEPTYEVEV